MFTVTLSSPIVAQHRTFIRSAAETVAKPNITGIHDLHFKFNIPSFTQYDMFFYTHVSQYLTIFGNASSDLSVFVLNVHKQHMRALAETRSRSRSRGTVEAAYNKYKNARDRSAFKTIKLCASFVSRVHVFFQQVS